MDWFKQNLISIVILMLVSLFVLWAVGYVRGGEYGKTYDLASCWAGLGTLGSAGVVALLAYLMDSKYNSKEGEKPQ